MAHFAKIEEDGIVSQVIVVLNEDCGDLNFPESEIVGQQFLASINVDGIWKQTSYNANFRKMYAIIGGTYDDVIDEFVAPVNLPVE
jgi:hypothetical protein